MQKFKVVLHQPEIPGNTGSIGRSCVALGAELILIRPYGFDLSEKSVRRAGLDYWKHVKITEYDSIEEFFEKEKPASEQLFLFSKTGEQSYFQAKFTQDSYLIFGSETRGLDAEILEKYHERCYALPMFSDHVRSLNLSNCATAVMYECLRQTSPHLCM